jgi:hypothetical protein
LSAVEYNFSFSLFWHAMSFFKSYITNNLLMQRNMSSYTFFNDFSWDHIRSSCIYTNNDFVNDFAYCVISKYLGVTIDSHLSLSFHVRKVCRSAYFHLYHIGKIRRYLGASTAHRLVHAFVLSRLDYCNSTFSGLPSALLDRLQMVLNSATRLFLRVRRREHDTRHLQYLNWLPIWWRIDFKLNVLAYHCLCRCCDRPLPPPSLLKLLWSTLPFLPYSRLYFPSKCPGCSAPSPFNSPVSYYHPWRPSFLSLLLAGFEFSSTQCYICPLSFHFPFPPQEAFVKSELPKVKFNYIYLRDSNTFQCHLI